MKSKIVLVYFSSFVAYIHFTLEYKCQIECNQNVFSSSAIIVFRNDTRAEVRSAMSRLHQKVEIKAGMCEVQTRTQCLMPANC
jgi:hypothetical protein